MIECLFRFLNILLWIILFILGSSPEDTFNYLRVISGVTVWKAMVNSPWIITILLTGYYMHFIYHRCREVPLSNIESWMKSLQSGLMAFLAFLPLRPDFDLYKNIPQQEYIKIIYALLVMKVFFWIFLLTIVVFYYFDGNSIFKRLPDLFIDFYNRKDTLSTPIPNNSTQEKDTSSTN
ncbi:MAG TPA: hypothetical protein PLT82_02715 [Candidatus Hydrogenedens sp.]|nr:hypothetical protein [Candidatus Hydrogenedens sp.]HOK09038.1 hypothetical protein [Candidatus Hydrogenedens sp.]HOL19373.1 hypothetical protein [Candidatus Hydrogenedens sp.]HPP58025.1 hypothetical protein [Candidatus Hydrogenedens sp.]